MVLIPPEPVPEKLWRPRLELCFDRIEASHTPGLFIWGDVNLVNLPRAICREIPTLIDKSIAEGDADNFEIACRRLEENVLALRDLYDFVNLHVRRNRRENPKRTEPSRPARATLSALSAGSLPELRAQRLG